MAIAAKAITENPIKDGGGVVINERIIIPFGDPNERELSEIETLYDDRYHIPPTVTTTG
jgi:hypothetical protein